MIKIAGKSEIGQSHIGKGVCQDACCFSNERNFVVAAVADGLGSSKHSDVASKMASERVVKYCVQGFNQLMSKKTNHSAIELMIRKVFDQVNFEIKQHAGDNLDDFDTTLTLAIFIKGRVFYGHAGDSGIIALRSDGKFECVTEQQNGSGIGKERPVYPLSSESHWVFGTYQNTARALFLMTDGVWNKCVPPLLEGQQFILDHNYLYFLYSDFSKQALSAVDNWISKEVSAIAPNEINYDDKTLMVVIDNSVGFKQQPQDYYDFPSDKLWKELLIRHENELYPYRNQMQNNSAQGTANIGCHQQNSAPRSSSSGNSDPIISKPNKSYRYSLKTKGKNRLLFRRWVYPSIIVVLIAVFIVMMFFLIFFSCENKQLTVPLTPQSESRGLGIPKEPKSSSATILPQHAPSQTNLENGINTDDKAKTYYKESPTIDKVTIDGAIVKNEEFTKENIDISLNNVSSNRELKEDVSESSEDSELSTGTYCRDDDNQRRNNEQEA